MIFSQCGGGGRRPQRPVVDKPQWWVGWGVCDTPTNPTTTTPWGQKTSSHYHFLGLNHRISTARKEKGWGRHLFHQIEPN